MYELYALALLGSVVFQIDAIPANTQDLYHRTLRARSSFNNGTPLRTGQVLNDTGSVYCKGSYGVNPAGGLPLSRGNQGKLLFYGEGEGNTATGVSDQWIDQGGVDNANQSACGIPHNAYYISHVAIHPYWLKYAPLDRYCRPDVCISFWDEHWQTDMMLKVTDICSTDPNKTNSCQQPGDIKIDRTKAKIWSGQGNDPRQAKDIPGLDGDAWASPTVWFFRYCWDDGMMQDAYDHQDNWFASPKFYNNLDETGNFANDQFRINQVKFPPNQHYNNCAYNTSCTGTAIDPYIDWSPSDPNPSWSPICGGQGFSGNTAPATSCPGLAGVGGTPDTSIAQSESNTCLAEAQQAEAGARTPAPAGIGGSSSELPNVVNGDPVVVSGGGRANGDYNGN